MQNSMASSLRQVLLGSLVTVTILKFVNIMYVKLKINAGAVAARGGLWGDNYYVYHMYHPECYGNESNILECSYGEQDTVPRSCNQRSVLYNYRSYYSNSDVTSVICLSGKI